jgi:hypothetical protein
MTEGKVTLREWLRRLLRIGAETGEAGKEYLQRQRQILSLTSDVRRAQAKKQDLYDLMGRKVYALHKRGKVQNKDLLALCGQVDAQNALIQQHEAEIERLKAEARRQREIAIEDETPLVEAEVEATEAEEAEPTVVVEVVEEPAADEMDQEPAPVEASCEEEAEPAAEAAEAPAEEEPA